MHKVVEKISQLFDQQGTHTYGENVTQTEHAVQCAELAVRANESAELVSAALLHDIGHLLATTDVAFGNYKHDAVGAEYLAEFFPAAVTEPIRLHAQAKRYLCSTESAYLTDLSAASLDSLQHQGGLMNEMEQLEFMQLPFAIQAIKLRRWDDEGKVDELSERSFEHYLPYLNDSIQSNVSPKIGNQHE